MENQEKSPGIEQSPEEIVQFPRKIPLTPGKFAIVDNDVFEELVKHKWYCKPHRNLFYACRGYKSPNEKLIIIKMHREIMKAEKGVQIDHIDHDGLNNQKSNLRLCNSSENAHNRTKYFCNTSGYKGVSWHKKTKKFQAKIRINMHDKHLGLFSTPLDAAQAYNIAAQRYHGEFACLNKI